jgi:xanthine dehydrogenase iron-sulfur cluster and FAD-binding subunit A
MGKKNLRSHCVIWRVKRRRGSDTCYSTPGFISSTFNHFANLRRVSYCVVHLNLINGTIWIKVDATNVSIALRLEASGVPKKDIVFGGYAPYKRTLDCDAAA